MMKSNNGLKNLVKSMNKASSQDQITELKGQFKDKREKNYKKDNQRGTIVITLIIKVVIVSILTRENRRGIKRMIENLISEVDKIMSQVTKLIEMILEGFGMKIRVTTHTMTIDNAQSEETIVVMRKRVEDMVMMITKGTHHHLTIEDE